MIKPLPGYILLEEFKPVLEKGGILLSEDVDMEKPNLAIVLDSNSASGFITGDTVLFKRHLFDEIKLDNKQYLIGKEEEVVAVVS